MKGIGAIWSGWLSDWAASGSVTRDDNRGISSIEYNALGLPSRISVGSGSSIEYIYSADGTKLGSRYTEGRAASYALEAEQPEQSAQPYAYISEDYDYIGCYEFRNRNLFRVNTPYGYYLAGDFTPYMRDYQGNNRNEAGYYAYGLPTSDSDVKSYDPYLYGDKMLYTLKGLNIYDFLARTYAPDIARFMQPDPMAGDYHWLSPYAYCAGDPINFIDPDGCKVRIANNKSDAINNIAKIAATNMGDIVLRRLISSNKIYTLKGVYLSRSSEFCIDGLKIKYVTDPDPDSCDGANTSSLTAMSHETMHAYDYDKNFWDKENTGRAQGYIEGRAVSFENYIRKSYGLYPLREKYGQNRRVQGLHMFECDNKLTNFKLVYSSANGQIMAYSYQKTTETGPIYLHGILFAPKWVNVSINYVIVRVGEDGYVDYDICSSYEDYNAKIKNYSTN